MTDDRVGTLGKLARAISGTDCRRLSAYSALWAHLRSGEPDWLLRCIAWPSGTPLADRKDIACEACEHLLLKCSELPATTWPTDDDAGRWCAVVLRNFMRARLRSLQRRNRARTDRWSTQEGPTVAHAVPGVINEAVKLLEREIVASTRPCFAESVVQAFRCFMLHRLGADSDEVPTCKREREALYQRRRRGKLAAQKAYANLGIRGLEPEIDAILRLILEEGRAKPRSPQQTHRRSESRATTGTHDAGRALPLMAQARPALAVSKPTPP